MPEFTVNYDRARLVFADWFRGKCPWYLRFVFNSALVGNAEKISLSLARGTGGSVNLIDRAASFYN